MIIFNATEFIEDCMATGMTYAEAVVAAREEIALRKEISQRNKGKEYPAARVHRQERSQS